MTPPGTVAVAAEEAARYTRFLISIQALGMPPESQIVWQLSSDTTANRNRACADIHGEWLWFIDDDHAFRPDILRRLLEHDVDIVAPVVLRRHQPFMPVACLDDEVLDLKKFGPLRSGDACPKCGHELFCQPETDGQPCCPMVGGCGWWPPSDADVWPLIEVDHTGSAGMLIRRHVIEAMTEPWFELGNGISKDVNFCRAARVAGFKIHLDLGTRMGHITPAVIWPVHDDADGWVTGFSIADGFEIAVDLARESEYASG